MLKSILKCAKFSFPVTKKVSIDNLVKSTCLSATNHRFIHITSPSCKEIRAGGVKIKVGNKSGPALLDGETTIDIDDVKNQINTFPDRNTPNILFDGIPFKELPIINIKSTPNNTIMTVSNYKGSILLLHTSGIEGFKNAKKGTNIAAQQAAITIGTRALEKEIKTVRIRVQGIGPGRMSAIKGLQIAGINIVSITDDTRVSWNPPRARKQRRI